ncbi:exonuclease SbcCD subunit D [Chloroflexota bacterium]
MPVKQIRILHASDLHIENGSPEARPQRALQALVGLAASCRADLIIFCGDLFDNNRVSRETVAQVLSSLSTTSVPVLILPGNHDCLIADSVYRQITELPPGIRLFTEQDGEQFVLSHLDLTVWGKSIMSYSGDQRPMAGVPARAGTRWNIAMAHGYYTGAKSNGRYSLAISQEEIIRSRMDYVALGHDSLFRCVCSDPVMACYCGSASQPGTAAVVDIDESGVTVRCHRLFK